MLLRSSHLITLTMSVMCVSRTISLLMRCERSPTPVRVGVNTLCPPFCRRSATRRQHQPPCQAPCTRTKVFGGPVCADAGAPPNAAALAPAPRLPARRGGSWLRRWLQSSCPPYALFVGPILLGTRPFVPNGANGKRLGMRRLSTLPGHPAHPVDNRDNPPPSRRRPARAYTGRSSESPGSLHALSASVPRRAAYAASGFRGRRPARAAQEGGTRMEGTITLQQGENAVVFRQRPENGVVRFLLRQEWHHFRFRDDDRGAHLPRGGRAAGGAGRYAVAQDFPGGGGTRRAPQDAQRRRRAGGEVFRVDACVARGRQGARLYRRPRDRSRDAGQVPPGLCPPGALRAQGTSRQGRDSDRGHDRGGTVGRRRRHSRGL